MRRATVVLLIVLLDVVACGGSGPAPAASAVPLEHVNVAWVAKVANMAPALVAYEAGYFKGQGLDVSLNFINSSPNGIASLLAGETDFLQVAGTAVVTSATQAKDSSKAPVLVIGAVNRAVWKLMANKSLTSPSQLKGKVICITRAGTADAIALSLYLKRIGLDPAHDVTVLAGGSIEACVAAMESNRVASGVFSTPVTALLSSKGYAVLGDFGKENIQIQQLGVAVSRAYAQAHRQTVLKFTRAYIQGIHRFKTDRAFAEQVMRKYLDTTDQVQLDDAFNTYKDVFEKVPIPSDASLQSIIDTVPEAKGKSPGDFVNPSVVQKLQQQGFIKQVYGT